MEMYCEMPFYVLYIIIHNSLDIDTQTLNIYTALR